MPPGTHPSFLGPEAAPGPQDGPKAFPLAGPELWSHTAIFLLSKAQGWPQCAGCVHVCGCVLSCGEGAHVACAGVQACACTAEVLTSCGRCWTSSRGAPEQQPERGP